MDFNNLGIHLSTQNRPMKTPGIYTAIDIEGDVFLLDGGNMYLKFIRKSSTTFQLEELLPVDYQHTHPIVSWTGVLWTRQEALRAHQSLTSYSQGGGQID